MNKRCGCKCDGAARGGTTAVALIALWIAVCVAVETLALGMHIDRLTEHVIDTCGAP